MPTKTNTQSDGQKMPAKLRLKLANECTNLLEKVKLSPLDKKYRFCLAHSKNVNDVTYNKLMSLFEVLMREMYENSSWGWNEVEKMAEWKHHRTWIMMVTENNLCDISKQVSFGDLPDDDESIIAFMCFRFERGADKNECALYVYELHVETNHQRQGLGQELMLMAKLFARGFKMDKIMLTVFRSNSPALQFYQKLKFAVDKSSPAKNEADYTILSSKVK